MKTDTKTSKAAAPATRSHSQPAQPTRDERFYDLFKSALQGLCSQFEQLHPDGFIRNDGGKAELARSKQLAIRAWNIAVFASAQFEQESSVEEFNKKVS